MKTSNISTSPLHLPVVSGCVASGWFVWYSARWLVGRDAIYLRLHNQGLRFITQCAELVAFAGLLPVLLVSLLLGLLAATWLARRRAWRKLP